MIKILPILIMLSLNFCLYKIYNKKAKEYDFKIFDFDFNGFCIITYFLIYLYIIFWYKISYINKTTDLKPFIIYIKNLCCFTLKQTILFILIIICFIYIIRIIHKFFKKELRKRFIVLQITYDKINITPYLLQTIKQQVDTLLTRVFIDETDYGINKILFNMYYKQKTIKYINIHKEYQNVIMRYISLNLQRNLIKYPEPLLDEVLGAFYFKINTDCTFFLVETIEKGFYSNEHGDHLFPKNENVDTNIYDFFFTRKIFIYLKKTITKIIMIIKRNTRMLKK